MQNNWKFFIFLLAVIAIGGLAGLYFTDKTSPDLSKNVSNQSGKVAGASTIESDNYDQNLAETLADKGAVFYGSYKSADSQAQKALFGDAAKYLNYVECDASGPSANPDECTGENIIVYPTWSYQGRLYTGVQSLAKLANLINFSQ